MKKNDLAFGKVVNNIRISRNLTIRSLCEVLNLSIGYICDIEKGNRYPTVDLIQRLIANFELTEQEINMLWNTYSRERLSLPPELLHYLINNDLLQSIHRIKEVDPKGEKIKSLALTINPKNQKN